MGPIHKEDDGRLVFVLPSSARLIVGLIDFVFSPAWRVGSRAVRSFKSLVKRTWVAAALAICVACYLWMVASFVIFTARIVGCDNLTLIAALASSPVYHWPTPLDSLPASANIQETYERTNQLESAVINLRFVIEQETGVLVQSNGAPLDLADIATRISEVESRASDAVAELGHVRVSIDGLTADVADTRNLVTIYRDAASEPLESVTAELEDLRGEVKDARALLNGLTVEVASAQNLVTVYRDAASEPLESVTAELKDLRGEVKEARALLDSLTIEVASAQNFAAAHRSAASAPLESVAADLEDLRAEVKDARASLIGLATDVASTQRIVSVYQDTAHGDVDSLMVDFKSMRVEVSDTLDKMSKELEEVHQRIARFNILTHAPIEEKTDFALYTTGAMTIRDKSSPDRNPPQNVTLTDKAISMILAWPFGSNGDVVITSKPWPTGSDMAIHYDVQPGYCWPFDGSRGHLAVQLPVFILIDEVAIYHTRAHWDNTPAPRRMEAWALIRSPYAQKVVDWEAGRDHAAPPELKSAFGSDKYLRIAEFEYDLSSPVATQSFEVDSSFRALEIPLDVVILYILDNWGNPNYTCLYRFKVHGRSATTGVV